MTTDQQKVTEKQYSVTNIILCPFKALLSIAKLTIALLWSILRLVYFLAKKLNFRLFTANQQNQQNQVELNLPKRANKRLSNMLKKCLDFDLSKLEKLLTQSIISLEKTIPAYLDDYFPKQLSFAKKEQKQMSLQQMKSSSNQVLIQIKEPNQKDGPKSGKKSQNQSRTYYVPTYLRVKVKNFTAIDLDKLEAEVNVDIIISFVYGNCGLVQIPREVVSRLQSEVMLNFQRDDPLRLDQKDSVHITMKNSKHANSISFTVRKKLHMRIESRVYWTPFQRLYLVLPITIQQLTAKPYKSSEGSEFEASVKFNYMDNEGAFVKLDFTDEKNFGYYSLVETMLAARYSNQRITSIGEFNSYDQKAMHKEKNNPSHQPACSTTKNKNQQTKIQQLIQQQENERLLNSPRSTNNRKNRKSKNQSTKNLLQPQQPLSPQKGRTQTQSQQQKENQLKYFQYSFFKIPIYKHPMASLLMIFLPLWSLAIINLGIFFQENSLNERIASIASLMIAFIALNETIRSQIPPHPKVVFVELLVYAEIIACFLCLVDSYEVSQVENYRINWRQSELFLACLTIFIAEIIIIFLICLHHYYVMVPFYELQEKKQKVDKFNHKVWRNPQCDIHFKSLIQKTNQYIQKLNKTAKNQTYAQPKTNTQKQTLIKKQKQPNIQKTENQQMISQKKLLKVSDAA